MAGSWRLWLRWSWRDLKRRWIQMMITALVIALGTGLFAGLSSVSRWRQMSNEQSFEVTLYHDIRASLGAGGFVEAGSLSKAAATAAGPAILAMEERLVVPAQVRVRGGDGAVVLVAGQVVGYDYSDGDPAVDLLYPVVGRGLSGADQGRDIAVMERNFGKYHDLGEAGTVAVSGGAELEYVGQSISPEYVFVITGTANFLAEASFGVVFTTLPTAQRLTGLEGKTNDLVIRVAPGQDPDAVAAMLGEALAPLGATVGTREDEDVYRLLTEDPESDQQVYNVLAGAIFAGALFAAFNITSRMVEAQRREFGIAMALGVARWRIAIRPMLVGAQIALMGVALGILIGLLIGWAVGGLLRSFLTLPVIVTPFQWDLFLAYAAAGFVAPILAITYPVWRAVRVPPIRAIRTGHLAVRSPGLARLAGKIPLAGDTFARLPVHNFLRAPRRTLLTAAGIAAIIGVLVGLLAYIDSFYDALDSAEAETAGDNPDRLEIDMDRFYPVHGPEAQAVLTGSGLTGAEPRIRVGATYLANGEEIDGLLELTDMQSPVWTPSAQDGLLPTGAGVVIASEAARDLGVRVGDTITIRHPKASLDGGYALVQSEVVVAATHGHPIRVYGYMDYSQAALLGLAGQMNRATALPGIGGVEAARERLFLVGGVVAVQEAAEAPRQLRSRMSQFLDLIYIMELALCAVAALIAYNTASINFDERSREQATMLAYGVRPRTIVRMAVTEAALLGLVSTLLGLALGYVFARWLIDVLAPRVLPDIGLNVVISTQSLVIVFILGVFAVAVTPLFGWRRLRRVNLPSALRLME